MKGTPRRVVRVGVLAGPDVGAAYQTRRYCRSHVQAPPCSPSFSTACLLFRGQSVFIAAAWLHGEAQDCGSWAEAAAGTGRRASVDRKCLGQVLMALVVLTQCDLVSRGYISQVRRGLITAACCQRALAAACAASVRVARGSSQ